MNIFIAYDWGGRTIWRVDGRGIGVAFGYDDASRSTTNSHIHRAADGAITVVSTDITTRYRDGHTVIDEVLAEKKVHCAPCASADERIMPAKMPPPPTIFRSDWHKMEPSMVKTYVVLLGITACAIGGWGCTPRTPRRTTGEWRPALIVPFEVRDLPPAARVISDYELWVACGGSTQRYYRARFPSNAVVEDLGRRVRRAETPLGAVWITYQDFRWYSASNGTYVFTWDLYGRHNTGFVLPDSSGREYWVIPYGCYRETSQPQLDIFGIEGIERHQGVGGL